MQNELNNEPRELSIDELNDASGGMPVCGLPLAVVAVAAAGAFRAFIGGLMRMF
jgi:hypothetical protein